MKEAALRTSLLFAGFVCMALLVPGLAQGQGAVVTGQVTDANEVPIAGVAVFIEEMSSAGIGTITNEEGRYRLQAPAERVEGQTVTLVARSLGQKTVRREITLSEGVRTESFQLERDVLALDALVVTGVAGETPQKKLAFSVGGMSAEQIDLAPPATAPVRALQGRVPGVQVVQGSGAPGTGISVRLRGTTSINGNSQPLYIVDGVILTEGQVDIEPQDIESIEVVKGAAAASIYGSRAQNGVVQITTNRGAGVEAGRTEFTVRSEYGVNTMGKFVPRSRAHAFMVADSAFVDAEGNEVEAGDWLRQVDIGGEAEIVKATYGDASIEPSVNGVVFQDDPYPGDTYDQLDRFFDPGGFVRNFAAVSHRNANTNFRLSFGRLHEPGVIDGLNGYDRNNLRLNMDHHLGESLNLSVSGYVADSYRDRMGALNPFRALVLVSPNVDLLAPDSTGELATLPDPRRGVRNPFHTVQHTDIDINRQRLVGNATLRYSLLNGVDIEGTISYDRVEHNEESFYDKGFLPVSGDDDFNDGRYIKRNNYTDGLNASLTAAFNRRFGDLATRARANLLFERRYFNGTRIQGNGLAARGVRSLDNVIGEVFRSSTIRDVRGLYGFLATQADYKDRYIVDLLIRRDGSSKFGRSERWHTYYRASGAYRLSEEPWWFGGDAISEFKLRYSLGTAGAQPTFAAQYEAFALNDGKVNKVVLGNRFLKPELQTEHEAGVNMALFDRISADLVYAHTTIEDQILRVPLAAYYGYNTQWKNAGTIESNTIEASLEATLLQRRNAAWNLGLIFDRTRQRITDMNVPPFRGGPLGAFEFRAGEELGAIYGHRWVRDLSEMPEEMQAYAGAFAVNDEGYLVAVGEGNGWKDGLAKELWGTMVDVDGDGQGDYEWGMPIRDTRVEGTNRVKIGSSTPDFNLGLNSSVHWNGIAAHMLWHAQIGGDVYNRARQRAYIEGVAADLDQTGKPEHERKPLGYYRTFWYTSSSSSRFIEDATYLKLRELSLSYRLDRDGVRKLFGDGVAGRIESVRLGVTGRNLLTFTDYTGYDPEVGVGDATLIRFDRFSYPRYRRFTGRIEVQF